jgi:hypothetical protein
MPYDAASAVLTKELRGTKIRVAGRTLRVDSLHLTGVGDGRVAVGLAVRGPVRGVLYTVGRPVIDTLTSTLSMPDLEYDVGTSNLLVGGLAWLGGPTITDFLRSNVRINLAPVIEQGRVLLEKNLNRQLAPGVELHAQVSVARVLGVRAAPHALLARGVATGQGELVLDLVPEQSAETSSKSRPTGAGTFTASR